MQSDLELRAKWQVSVWIQVVWLEVDRAGPLPARRQGTGHQLPKPGVPMHVAGTLLGWLEDGREGSGSEGSYVSAAVCHC